MRRSVKRASLVLVLGAFLYFMLGATATTSDVSASSDDDASGVSTDDDSSSSRDDDIYGAATDDGSSSSSGGDTYGVTTDHGSSPSDERPTPGATTHDGSGSGGGDTYGVTTDDGSSSLADDGYSSSATTNQGPASGGNDVYGTTASTYEVSSSSGDEIYGATYEVSAPSGGDTSGATTDDGSSSSRDNDIYGTTASDDGPSSSDDDTYGTVASIDDGSSSSRDHDIYGAAYEGSASGGDDIYGTSASDDGSSSSRNDDTYGATTGEVPASGGDGIYGTTADGGSSSSDDDTYVEITDEVSASGDDIYGAATDGVPGSGGDDIFGATASTYEVPASGGGDDFYGATTDEVSGSDGDDIYAATTDEVPGSGGDDVFGTTASTYEVPASGGGDDIYGAPTDEASESGGDDIYSVTASTGEGSLPSDDATYAATDATTYIVSASPSAGDGTYTIDQAMSLAAAGDTVSLMDGTYDEAVVSKNNGKEGSPITVQGGRGAIINGAISSKNVWIMHSFITLKGFSVQGKMGNSGQEDSYVVKCVYVEGPLEGFVMDGLSVENCGTECVRLKRFVVNSEITDNDIANCGIYDFGFPSSDKNGEGIYIGTSSTQWGGVIDDCNSNLVKGNRIDTNGNECVDIKEGSEDNVVEYNTCKNQLDEKSGCYDSRGDGNTFRYNEGSDCKGAGVRLGGHEVNGHQYGVRNSVYDNSFSNVRTGALRVMVSGQGEVCGNSCAGGGCTLTGNAYASYASSWDKIC